MIQDLIFTQLSTYPGLNSLVGNRIYPLILPESSKFPAVTYSRVSTPRVISKDGPSGLASPRFQFSCWSPDYDEAKAVAEQVSAALKSFGGADFVIPENEVDLYEQDTKLYQIPVDFTIWHQE